MKRVALILTLGIIVGSLMGGCIGVEPIQCPKSPIIADWKAPLSTNLNKFDLGTKVGKATNKTYAFGLVSIGDNDIKTAADNGGIKVIKHVDYHYQNFFLFVYQEITVIVYGD
jgi:hypothetical protein